MFENNYGPAQSLDGGRIAGEVLFPLGSYILQSDLREKIVNVITAQMGIAAGGKHLEDAAFQLEDRNVKCSAAQIVNRDDAFLPLVEPVGQSRSGGFIHQPEYVQAGDPAGVFGCLPLSVVEIRRDRNDRFGDRNAEASLCIPPEPAQDVRGNFRRGKNSVSPSDPDYGLAAFRYAEGKPVSFPGDIGDPLPHEPLHRIDRPVGTGRS